MCIRDRAGHGHGKLFAVKRIVVLSSNVRCAGMCSGIKHLVGCPTVTQTLL